MLTPCEIGSRKKTEEGREWSKGGAGTSFRSDFYEKQKEKWEGGVNSTLKWASVSSPLHLCYAKGPLSPTFFPPCCNSYLLSATGRPRSSNKMPAGSNKAAMPLPAANSLLRKRLKYVEPERRRPYSHGRRAAVLNTYRLLFLSKL